MEYSLHLSDVANEEVRQAIAAPLVRFNESFAELPDYPKGFSRYFMRKELAPQREIG